MKKRLLVIKILVSASVLYFVFRNVDAKTLLRQFSEIRAGIISFGFAVFLMQSVLSSLKWKIILTADGKSVPLLYLLKCYLIGNFISLFLPSSFGGDVYRSYALGKYNKDYLQNTSSVLFDRLSGLFALASLSIISFGIFYRSLINYPFIICYGMGILLFLVASSRRGIALFNGVRNKFLKMYVGIMESFNKYSHDGRVLVSSLLIAFIFQSNIVLVNKLFCYALKIDISLAHLYTIIPLVYLTEALPISINGLGVREGAYVFFFHRLGFRERRLWPWACSLSACGMRLQFR
jgi:uncharacterized protein (TIRG00374 family)